MSEGSAYKGRGAGYNPTPRYARTERAAAPPDVELPDEPGADPRTVVSVDASRSVITRNDSPDLPFSRSLNPYRGCEHGCIYCFACRARWPACSRTGCTATGRSVPSAC